jgi:putative endonuclease
MKIHRYYVYISACNNKKVLYIGVTNSLQRRLSEHLANRVKNTKSFTGKYHVVHLLYFEVYRDIRMAISREKQLKGWRRAKKEALINTINPEWVFLEEHPDHEAWG